MKNGVPQTMPLCQMNQEAPTWTYFVCYRLLPVSHFSTIPVQRALMVYAIMKGFSLDLGRAIPKSIKHISRGTTTGGLGHGSFITHLC